MALYTGANYHPHDWPEKQWKKDIALRKEAGFNRGWLGHLCRTDLNLKTGGRGILSEQYFDNTLTLAAYDAELVIEG